MLLFLLSNFLELFSMRKRNADRRAEIEKKKRNSVRKR